MANLNKYKRSNINIFEESANANKEVIAEAVVVSKNNKQGNVGKGRKAKASPLTEKFTMNFTKEEAEKLYKINTETGIPISTLLRKKLSETGLFD